MSSDSPTKSTTSIREDDQDFSLAYLDEYWPEQPGKGPSWADNAVLMLAYQEAALAVRDHFSGRQYSMLDVSTGPALAPLLAMISCVSEVQLSDYVAANRDFLRTHSINYWREYVPMLVRLFERPETKEREILERLDKLRSARPPVPVDLFRDPPLDRKICGSDYDVISMQFVADSITTNIADYKACLNRVLNLVKSGGALIMSAIVDSDVWSTGDTRYPSPSVSEAMMKEFLLEHGLEVIYRAPSMRLHGLTYTGGWVVLAAIKRD